MADVAFIAHREGRGQNVSYLKKFVCLETTVDTSDTITIPGWSSIDSVQIFTLDTAADVTASLSTNVITITEAALSGERIIALVVGN